MSRHTPERGRRWSLALVPLALVACDGGVFETSHGAVDDGNAALVEGRVDEARERYTEAAEELPATAPLDYVRGLAESAAGEHEAATQHLLRALDTHDPVMLQQVRAALGLAYARWAVALERAPAAGLVEGSGDPDDPDAAPDPKKAALSRWHLAVEHLEDALRLDPTDEASLRNLEVALLRVDPPCSARDDELERNNSAETAAAIEVSAEAEAPAGGPPGAAPPATSPEMADDELSWTQQLHSCPDDPDWYALELSAGDRIAAELSIPDKPGARLSLELRGPDGEVLSPGVDEDGAPRVAFDLAERPVPVAGRYLLRVDNVDLEETSYGLEVTVRPSCASVEDRFEDNDGADQAVLMTAGSEADLKLCPDDEDWYAIDLAEGESLFLYVTPQGEDQGRPEGEGASGDEDQDGAGDDGADGAGDDGEAGADEGEAEPAAPPPATLLTTEIRDAEGALRAVGAPTGQGRVSALLTPGPGRYTVRIVGAEAWEGRYTMNLEVVPPCPDGNDRYEPNETPAEATDVAAVTEQMSQQQGGAQPQGGPTVLFARVCPGDVDWYTITDEGEHPAIVSAVFEHAKGDLSLELFDADGLVSLAASDVSSPLQNGEAVAAPPRPEVPDAAGTPDDDPDDSAPPPPRTFKVRVQGSGEEAENFYLLEVKQPSPSPDSQEQDQEQDQQDEGDQEPPEDPQQDESEQDEQDEGDEEPERDEQQEEQRSDPLQDALDKLDRNPDNLEAQESARKSPVSNHRPRKDW